MSKFQGFAPAPSQPLRSQVPWRSHLRCYNLPTSPAGVTATRVIANPPAAAGASSAPTTTSSFCGSTYQSSYACPDSAATAAASSRHRAPDFRSYQGSPPKHGIRIAAKTRCPPPPERFGKRVLPPHAKQSQVPLAHTAAAVTTNSADVVSSPPYKRRTAAEQVGSGCIIPGGRRHYAAAANMTTTTTPTWGRIRTYHNAHNRSTVEFSHGWKPAAASSTPPTPAPATTTTTAAAAATATTTTVTP